MHGAGVSHSKYCEAYVTCYATWQQQTRCFLETLFPLKSLIKVTELSASHININEIKSHFKNTINWLIRV